MTALLARVDDLAAEALPRLGAKRDLRPTTLRKCCGLAQRALEAGRRDVDRVVAQVVAQLVRDALAERMVDAAADAVDEDA